MIVMNPFVEENEAAFVDFITSVATPLPSPEDSARCTMSNTEALQQSVASQRRASIQDELQRDSLPTLPHLLNLSRDLAMLATLSLRCAQHHESKQTSQEGQKAQRRPRFLSKNFERFLDLCYHYHRMAQVQARPSHINGSLYLPQLVSADMQLLPVEPATQTANPNLHRAGTSPFSDDLGRADSFNVTGNNGNRFGFKMSSPRRNRAQTVSSGGARNANIREPVTTTTTDAALDLPAFSEYTADDAPNLPSSPGPGIFFSQSVKTETTHRAEDASSIASDSGASVSRSSLSVNSEQKTGRLQRMLNRG